MSWLDIGTTHPPLEDWNWIPKVHRQVVQDQAVPGTPYSAAAALGLLARLMRSEDGASEIWARLQRREISAHHGIIRAWLQRHDAKFWLDLEEDAQIAIEVVSAQLDDLDARYAPRDSIWRRRFAQALRQRDTLASVAWSAAVAGRPLKCAAQLTALDAQGQRLLDGALDLPPIEDALLSALTEADWWLDPSVIIPVARGAQEDWQVVFLPLVKPLPARAPMRMAADTEALLDEGTRLGSLGPVEVRLIPRADGHIIRLSGPVELPYDLNEPGLIKLRHLNEVEVRVEVQLNEPRLWMVKLLESGSFVLSLRDHHLRLEVS